MPHFQVDDDLPFHPKAMEAGNAALGLWVRAGASPAVQYADGFITSKFARTLGTQAEISALVEAGLWTVVPGGYQFHEWLEDARTGAKRQQSGEESLQRRRDRAARNKRYQEKLKRDRAAAQGTPYGQVHELGRKQSDG